ncbi:MAG TPA: RES family NAD+ phosphorylase [Thermoanaerobaculia bacterium]
MERLPDPPSVAEILKKPVPERRIILPGTLLWRVFTRGGTYAVEWNELRHYGPTASRFDHHPDGTPRVHHDRGILYAAEQHFTAVAEFFQATRAINRDLNKPWIVQFPLTQPLSLLDLTGGWMLKVGGNSAIASGEREQSRKWSRVFHEAYPDADGLCYRSSLNAEWIAYALYERATRAFPKDPVVHAPLTDARIEPLIALAAAESGYDVL